MINCGRGAARAAISTLFVSCFPELEPQGDVRLVLVPARFAVADHVVGQDRGPRPREQGAQRLLRLVEATARGGSARVAVGQHDRGTSVAGLVGPGPAERAGPQKP